MVTSVRHAPALAALLGASACGALLDLPEGRLADGGAASVTDAGSGGGAEGGARNGAPGSADGGSAEAEAGGLPGGDCPPAAMKLYAAGYEDQILYTFDPVKLAFAPGPKLRCGGEGPIGLAVARDGTGIAYFRYGELYRVDMETGDCTALVFGGGFGEFSLSYALDGADASTETLYACSGAGLATMSATHEISVVGKPNDIFPPCGGACGLRGAGDGALFGFMEQTSEWDLFAFDKTTARAVGSVTLPIPSGGTACDNRLGMWLYQGDFFLYALGDPTSTLFRYHPADRSLRTILPDTPFTISAAAQSTCVR